jgi:NAD(P)-dependent dehydrogenase (short-subunit alcohol dehydrogenase family)
MGPLFSLSNKVAVVTGALGLLGRQHCDALARFGAQIIVTDTDQEKCNAFAKDLALEYSTSAFGYAMDITIRESLQKARNEILSQFGRIDVLVNNAAVNDKAEQREGTIDDLGFEFYPLEIWKRTLEVNVTGVFLCCQVFGSLMAEKGAGSIINIASTYGLVAPDQSLYMRSDGSRMMLKSPAYPATKGAVLSLTKYLAAYWGAKGVRVNALSPGGVENGQEEFFIQKYSSKTPLQRMAHPNDYQGAIVFLASDASQYMTGANMVVDGGWTIW